MGSTILMADSLTERGPHLLTNGPMEEVFEIQSRNLLGRIARRTQAGGNRPLLSVICSIRGVGNRLWKLAFRRPTEMANLFMRGERT